MTLLGYDISEWQGVVDHDRLTADFLIIRDVYATTHVDDQFAHNWAEARRTGRLRWSYSFVEPGWTSPTDSLAFTLAVHDDYQPGEGQMLDVERDVVNIVDWSLAWLAGFEQARGFKPVIYLTRYLLHSRDWSRVIAGNFGLALAVDDGKPDDFSGDPDLAGWPVLAVKQYQLGGPPVPGIATAVDRDAFNGDRNQWLAYGAPGSEPLSPPPPPPAPAPPPVGYSYTIVTGDTLSGIAARCGIGWRDLWNFGGNRQVIANPDLIFPGQVIRVPCPLDASPHGRASCVYVVRQGDTLWGIAQEHGMTWQDLWDFDGNRGRIGNPDLIYPGQLIKVPC